MLSSIKKTTRQTVSITVTSTVAIITILIAILSSALPVNALEIAAKDYPFPTKNAYVASVFSAFAMPQVKPQNWAVRYRSDRKEIKVLDRELVIKLAAFQQAKTAPLVLIVAGVGGDGNSGLGVALAEQLYKKGYNVIVLPSPVSWIYSVAISEAAAPGYNPRDKIEYYTWIKWVLNYAKKQGMRFNDISLMGYSYGGLLAGFLAPYDLTQSQPLFKKIIMINPAIDPEFGLRKLDALYDLGKNIPDSRKGRIKVATYEAAGSTEPTADPVQSVFKFMKQTNISHQDIQWLIGDSFRFSLSNIVLGTQYIIDRGVLKSPYSRFSLNKRTAESQTVSFLDYMHKIVIPSLTTDEQAKDTNYESSLYSQIEHLKNDSRVFVFQNADDFIVKESDIELLRQNFSDRLFLFPYGGHLGNALAPSHVQFYLNILAQ